MYLSSTNAPVQYLRHSIKIISKLLFQKCANIMRIVNSKILVSFIDVVNKMIFIVKTKSINLLNKHFFLIRRFLLCIPSTYYIFVLLFSKIKKKIIGFLIYSIKFVIYDITYTIKIIFIGIVPLDIELCFQYSLQVHYIFGVTFPT